jgi:signal transduction histidine kinase
VLTVVEERPMPTEPLTDRGTADRIGHELRTPLTTIRGYAEALDDDPALSEHQRECVRAILRGVARLQDAVERVEAQLRRPGD